MIKPEGKPTLVPESDKRPELNTVKAAQEDFAEEPDKDREECLAEITMMEKIPPGQPLEHYLETMAEKYTKETIEWAYAQAT